VNHTPVREWRRLHLKALGVCSMPENVARKKSFGKGKYGENTKMYNYLNSRLRQPERLKLQQPRATP